MFSFKNKASNTPCPHCQKKLPYSCIMQSIWHRENNELHCPLCNERIKSEKVIVDFWQTFLLGVTVVALAERLYTKYVDNSYTKSFIIAVVGGLIAMLFAFYNYLKKIKYVKG